MQIISDFINLISANEITTDSAICKLFVSLLLGGAVGFERKLKGQTAGIRTFALISMGATLAMIISIYVPQAYMGLKNGDPGRIAAQVVTGIGFLGAGAIIQMKGSVRGLTTAAGIWMIAAIGMTVGLGLWVLALSATLLIIVVLHWFERLEHLVSMGAEARTIRLVISDIVTDIDLYRKVLKENNVHLTNYYVEFDYADTTTRLNLIVRYRESTNYLPLFEKLCALYPTRSISLANQASI